VLLEVCPVVVRGPGVLVDGGVAVVFGALILVYDTQADRGPQVMPNSVPDWISTRSFSLRGVVMADWP
jgi:peptidoglycan/LPS O-acetylase OafA/YrhL